MLLQRNVKIIHDIMDEIVVAMMRFVFLLKLIFTGARLCASWPENLRSTAMVRGVQFVMRDSFMAQGTVVKEQDARWQAAIGRFCDYAAAESARQDVSPPPWIGTSGFNRLRAKPHTPPRVLLNSATDRLGQSARQ